MIVFYSLQCFKVANGDFVQNVGIDPTSTKKWQR